MQLEGIEYISNLIPIFCLIDTTNRTCRLDLNFRTGKNDNDDIVLNLSVDFGENVINRNSRINGEWGLTECKENLYEREDGALNPIESGELWLRCIGDSIKLDNDYRILFNFQVMSSNFTCHCVMPNFILLSIMSSIAHTTIVCRSI